MGGYAGPFREVRRHCGLGRRASTHESTGLMSLLVTEGAPPFVRETSLQCYV